MPKFLDVPSWCDTEGNMDTIENYSKLGTTEELVWTTLTGMQNISNFFTMNAALPWDDIVQVRLHFVQSNSSSNFSSAFPLTIEYTGTDSTKRSASFVYRTGAVSNNLLLTVAPGVFEETGASGANAVSLYGGAMNTSLTLNPTAIPGWGGVLTTYRGSNWSVECNNHLPMTSIITQVDYAIAETVSVDCQYLYDKTQTPSLGSGASAEGEAAIAIGGEATASGGYSIAIGNNAQTSGTNTIAIGNDAKASMSASIQIGSGTNDAGYSVQFANYPLLNLSTGTIFAERLLSLFPVGSYYITESTTTPASLFGGSWVRVQDKFLLGAGEKLVTSEGGEKTHTLTASEMPTHGHKLHEWTLIISDGATSGKFYMNESTNTQVNIFRDDSNQSRFSVTEGGSQPHNNMPPYRTVNIWRRTA